MLGPFPLRAHTRAQQVFSDVTTQYEANKSILIRPKLIEPIKDEKKLKK